MLLSSLYRTLVLPHRAKATMSSGSATKATTSKSRAAKHSHAHGNDDNDNDNDNDGNVEEEDITMDDLDCGSGWVHELVRGSSPASMIDNKPKRVSHSTSLFFLLTHSISLRWPIHIL
jgi:hypothetical protein